MDGHIGFVVVELHFHQARTLKEKRMLLRSLKDRLRNRFNVSLAELDGQDKWQWSRLGIVMINNDRRHIDRCLNHVREILDSHPLIALTAFELSYL